MATTEVTSERTGSPEEAAELLRSLGEAGKVVRVRGGGTKLDWGGIGDPVAVELETGGMAKILEHNVGCLLYTSDAADDSLRVDLGGRFRRRHAQNLSASPAASSGCTR